MGLFEKRVEACIAFVGMTNSALRLKKEEDLRFLYGRQVARYASFHYEDLPLEVLYFSDWTSRVYPVSLIDEVSEKGFSAFDSGDKEKLHKEMMKVLVSEYGLGMHGIDAHPKCFTDQGLFCILCRVRVKESSLG